MEELNKCPHYEEAMRQKESRTEDKGTIEGSLGYEVRGCFNCNGYDESCNLYIYFNPVRYPRKNLETQIADDTNSQVKKDEDLIGKSSGDTNHNSGSKNNLKDLSADNQPDVSLTKQEENND